MSQDPPVHQDARHPAMEMAHDKVDKVQMHDGAVRGAITKDATQAKAMKAAISLDLSTPPTLNSNDLNHSSPSLHQDPSEDVVSKTNRAAACVTKAAHDSSNLKHALNWTIDLNQAIPSAPAIVRPSHLARDTTPPPTPPSLNTTTNVTNIESSYPASQSEPHSKNTTFDESPSLHVAQNGAARSRVHAQKMVFGNASGRSGGAHRRRNFANTSAVTEEEADLTSKDRTKQKEAVRKFLAENVKDDWTWDWPRPTAAPTSPTSPLESPTGDLSQVITEGEWKERDEWTDNVSEGENELPPAKNIVSGTAKEDPFRFESPDGVGESIRKSEKDRKRRRKKRLADEMAWNDGVRCFIERRDAWTGARRVSRSPNVGLAPIRKQQTSASISSEDGGSSTAIEQEDESEWEADVEIPIAPPFLPPENIMRQSITSSNYGMIYDKIIINQMTPMCPINLKDIVQSCVKGWQRDGQWPPPTSALTPAGSKKGRKLSVASLFGLDNRDKEKADGDKRDGEKSPASPTGIRGKLGKMLHLRKEEE